MVVAASTVFGLIFVKQIKVNSQEMATAFAQDYEARVAGSSIAMPLGSTDNSARMEKSLNSMNFDNFDSNSAQIETQIDGL